MPLIKKNAQGYGYNYTDLAQITKLIEAIGEDYYQEIETIDGVDYIVTVRLDGEGNEIRRIRGCRIVEAKLSGKENPVQAYGAALTYCRRYSLLMAYGLATTDDDAEGFTVKEKVATVTKEDLENLGNVMKNPTGRISAKQLEQVRAKCKEAGVTEASVCEQIGVSKLPDLTSAQLSALASGWSRMVNKIKNPDGAPFK